MRIFEHWSSARPRLFSTSGQTSSSPGDHLGQLHQRVHAEPLVEAVLFRERAQLRDVGLEHVLVDGDGAARHGRFHVDRDGDPAARELGAHDVLDVGLAVLDRARELEGKIEEAMVDGAHFHRDG